MIDVSQKVFEILYRKRNTGSPCSSPYTISALLKGREGLNVAVDAVQEALDGLLLSGKITKSRVWCGLNGNETMWVYMVPKDFK